MKRPVLKIQYDSPVILTFALLCVIAMSASIYTDGWANSHLFSVYRSSLTDPLTYVRIFTHVLGHLNIEHLVSNMCLLLVLGPLVENRYGSINVLITIIITALVSGIIHFIFFPTVSLLGASGIVFALIFLSSISGIRGGNIPLSLILVGLLYLGREIYTLVTAADNISQITHIIGGVCGIVCGSLMAGKRKH